jgi:hypothetical protein
MIKSAQVTRAFDDAFTPSAQRAGLVRVRSKTSKWVLRQNGGDLHFQFQVNPKASAIPYCPGELWALVVWGGPRYNERDDGTVSYFQYTTDAENTSIQQQVKAVIKKVHHQNEFENEGFRAMRDMMVGIIDAGLEMPPEPRIPNYSLYYLDEADVTAWGQWFARHIAQWIERFQAAPETLEGWAWRVLWKDLPGNG